MSTRVEHIETDSKPRIESKPFNKIMFYCISAIRILFVFIAGTCIVGAIVSSIQFGINNANFFTFIQWAVGGFIYSIVFTQAKKMYEDMHSNLDNFFSLQIRRIRVMSISFLVLALLGLTFSFVAGYLTHESIPLFNLVFSLPGFPSPDTWDAVFSSSTYVSIPAIASIDITAFAVAGLLWSLSYVFQYGAWLQDETEMTV